MFKIKNLNSEIKTLEGKSIIGIEKGKSLTYGQALVSICETFQPLRGGTGETFKAYDLGIRMIKATDQIDLSKEEFDFLKSLVDRSVTYISVILGRLRDFLGKVEGTEDIKEK